MNRNHEREEALKACAGKLADRLSAQLSERLGGQEGSEKLLSMFRQCFLNTIETTVWCLEDEEVFLITGDIRAMWLRDSSCQVVHYMPYLSQEPLLADMVRGLIRTQAKQLAIDPYANAFNAEPNGACWAKDDTEDNPWDWERKYELDSLCYPIRLMYDYWKETGDVTVFDETIRTNLYTTLALWKTEQNHMAESTYYFRRDNCPPTDTLSCDGKGTPVAPTGMVWSGFRPSDDACAYGYLIPANFFAAQVCRYVAEIAEVIYQDPKLAAQAVEMESQIRKGLDTYAKTTHPEYGTIYAYETDGLGNYNCMDDANVPSLLSLPWLRAVDREDEVYQNTRRFILSKANPFYYEGSVAKGIGSPHTPEGYIWPIALCMQGITSDDQAEQDELMSCLVACDGGTGYMHEGFDSEDPDRFTRDWFAWANSMFALFVEKHYDL